jgi:hypothetical protein
MKNLNILQNQIDLVQQVVLCYVDFKMSPLETVEYIQKQDRLPIISNGRIEDNLVSGPHANASEVLYQA